ncbi:hypothetical protein D3C87_2127490 [compost metagenome]
MGNARRHFTHGVHTAGLGELRLLFEQHGTPLLRLAFSAGMAIFDDQPGDCCQRCKKGQGHMRRAEFIQPETAADRQM